MFNLKITTLGAWVSALLALTVAAVIVTSVFTVREIGNIGDSWRDFESGPAKKIAFLQEMGAAIGYGGMIHQFKNYVLRQDRPRIVKVQAKVRAATVAVTAYQAIGVTPAEKKALNDIGAVLAKYADALASAEKMAAEGADPRTVDKAIKISDGPAIKAIAVLNASLNEGRKSSSAAVYGAVDGTNAFTTGTAIAVVVVLFLVLAFLVWFTIFRLGRPIREMARVMGELAEGNNEVEVVGVGRSDELGDMADAVQVFKDNAIERIRLEAEAEEQRKEAEAAKEREMEAEAERQREEAEREKTEAERERKAAAAEAERGREEAERERQEAEAEAQRQREEAEAEEHRKAAAERERIQAMAVLADDFEGKVMGLVNDVSTAAGQMETTATELVGSAEETESRSTNVAAAAEQASANVQTVASAAEELSKSISEISQQVNRSAEISSQAVTKAEETNSEVQSLADAAEKIGEVVDLINDIASQTNLLALNATIEAARAGEAGKGFAVVASEVGNLANQTAKATEEIGSQIGGIQAATGSSVAAIEVITKTIGEISEIAATIASAVEEQGAATQEIARNVEQASSGTQDVSSNIVAVTETAGTTGSAAAQVQGAARSMTGQSKELATAVESFLADIRKDTTDAGGAAKQAAE